MGPPEGGPHEPWSHEDTPGTRVRESAPGEVLVWYRWTMVFLAYRLATSQMIGNARASIVTATKTGDHAR